MLLQQLNETKQNQFLKKTVQVKTAFTKTTGVLLSIKDKKHAVIKLFEPVIYIGSNDKIRKLNKLLVSTKHIYI